MLHLTVTAIVLLHTCVLQSVTDCLVQCFKCWRKVCSCSSEQAAVRALDALKMLYATFSDVSRVANMTTCQLEGKNTSNESVCCFSKTKKIKNIFCVLLEKVQAAKTHIVYSSN